MATKQTIERRLRELLTDIARENAPDGPQPTDEDLDELVSVARKALDEIVGY